MRLGNSLEGPVLELGDPLAEGSHQGFGGRKDMWSDVGMWLHCLPCRAVWEGWGQGALGGEAGRAGSHRQEAAQHDPDRRWL